MVPGQPILKALGALVESKDAKARDKVKEILVRKDTTTNSSSSRRRKMCQGPPLLLAAGAWTNAVRVGLATGLDSGAT